MNIVVFAVSAEHSGALIILQEFYKEVAKNKRPDINWCFVISTPELEPVENIKVRKIPWIKKSWFHRLYFDFFKAPKIVTEENAELVFSFQNMHINCGKVPQVLYLHQSIPFSDASFSFFDTPVLWIYKNILSHVIYNSLKHADKIFVQTRWMRDTAMKRAGLTESRFVIAPPSLSCDIEKYQDNLTARKTFFYPASFVPYKNHKVIIEAAKLLLLQGINDFVIVFTVDEKTAKRSGIKIGGVPLKCVGRLTHDQVIGLYSKSVLLFPSVLESFGIPLLEARRCAGFIVASDKPFSHEILESYNNAIFFEPYDARKLAQVMKDIMAGDIEYKAVNDTFNQEYASYGWKNIIEYIVERIITGHDQ